MPPKWSAVCGARVLSRGAGGLIGVWTALGSRYTETRHPYRNRRGGSGPPWLRTNLVSCVLISQTHRRHGSSPFMRSLCPVHTTQGAQEFPCALGIMQHRLVTSPAAAVRWTHETAGWWRPGGRTLSTPCKAGNSERATSNGTWFPPGCLHSNGIHSQSVPRGQRKVFRLLAVVNGRLQPHHVGVVVGGRARPVHLQHSEDRVRRK
mmetsp:Transcript_118695/g.206702  ORF Transcript_118695/g.206702 Transcript_118695/m.206702 type:complete len:206 (-) Transcript_118695:830-1447(-)